MRKRQSLTALRAFEAVARHKSFTKAAQELIVTRPAISKQVRLLEENLHCQLLARTNNSIELTATGIELFSGLRQAFDLIAATTERISSRSKEESKIKILVERDFASSWLAERVGQFLVEHPGISVEITADQNDQLQLEENFNFRIFYGEKQHSEFFKQQLLCHWIDIPLCTPQYAHTNIFNDNNLNNAHFLIDRNYHPWLDWFQYSQQIAPKKLEPQTTYNETTLCLYAAISGGGITIGDSILAFNAMSQERLIPPFKIGVKSDDAYWIHTQKENSRTKAEQSFEYWLLNTMQDYQQQVMAYFKTQSIAIIER
ncbi:MAG: DNA-binding transcriptional LysR family regulator [Oceanospirillaceae bacterium]|jgi:DNA-binding transcriptional LysR family regulator